MNLFSQNHNKRTRFTRMCIGEAVFALMDKKEYEKIKVSDIVKRAGVSRVTFYHYYETKEDALTDFFHEIVAGYILSLIHILSHCVKERKLLPGKPQVSSGLWPLDDQKIRHPVPFFCPVLQNHGSRLLRGDNRRQLHIASGCIAG